MTVVTHERLFAPITGLDQNDKIDKPKANIAIARFRTQVLLNEPYVRFKLPAHREAQRASIGPLEGMSLRKLSHDCGRQPVHNGCERRAPLTKPLAEAALCAIRRLRCAISATLSMMPRNVVDRR
jgi:hypothetical protein